MLKLRAFTAAEEEELPKRVKQAKTQHSRVYIKIQTIALLHAGKPVKEVAEVLGICENSVRTYLKQGNAHGGAGVAYKWGGGPKIKLAA